MEKSNIPKIRCTACESVFSIYAHTQLDGMEEIDDWVEVGFHGRFGAGEEGVWYCPFCGKGYYEASHLVDVDDDD